MNNLRATTINKALSDLKNKLSGGAAGTTRANAVRWLGASLTWLYEQTLFRCRFYRGHIVNCAQSAADLPSSKILRKGRQLRQMSVIRLATAAVKL